MKIRWMETEDISSVVVIEQQIFPDPWSSDSFFSAIHDKNNIYLVAEEEGKIVGYCGFWCSFENADLCNIAVLPSARRKGIAWRLLDEGAQFCAEKGVEEIFLEVRESNQAAIALYQKKGFSSINIRKKYYHHPTEDAIVMKRSIS